MAILSAFLKFKKEAAIIGRLLAGYADLEIGLMHCAQVVRDDLDTVLKTMFRTRGETPRINVADAFGRHEYAELGLGSEFAMAIGATRYCLKIRNQYAHCIWHDDYSKKLAFTNLEEIANSNAYLKNLQALTILHVDVPLLEAQEKYFLYTDQLLLWVNCEGRFRSKKIQKHPLSKPAQPEQPDLHIP